jgi:uncharacterized protein
MYYWEAFIIGLAGSLHCIGMCGPIALALPLKQPDWAGRSMAALLYNLGRAITYALMGAIFGALGLGFRLAGLQQSLSIALGIIMILTVLFPMLFRKWGSPAFLETFNKKLQLILSRRFSSPGYLSLFTIGLLNGLLPCGLVYMAIAGALVSGSLADGALFMFVFGLGTIPVMLALSLGGVYVGIQVRNRIRRIIPYAVILIGVLFILRGLNLGIPMISPKVETKKEKVVMECCKPKPADSLSTEGPQNSNDKP